MAEHLQDMDLNSRERRLVARRVQQQQLLNHLASTMMQGQASSSSGGNTEGGGIEAVGQMLVNWSKGKKEAQAKKVPKLVPKVAAPAAPWRAAQPAEAPAQPKTTATPPTGAPPPWSAPGLSDDALEALQQLGEQVQQRLQEEKDKEERSWYRSAAKEEDLDTEPPSCEEDKAPTTAEPVEFREKTEKPEEKKEDSPLEAPDWGGSNSQEPAEEQPPEENEKRCDVDSDSEGRLATMSPKELVKSLKVSYQAAIMNLEDAQKKEKLLGVSSRASTSLMQQLQELLNQHKSRKGKKESAGLKKSQRRKRGEENTAAITL